MKRLLTSLLLVLALASPALAIDGKASHSSHTSSSSQKRVYVKGYVRKDGMYVAPHYRIAPSASTSTSSSSGGGGTRSSYCTTCPRDANGKIKRSALARAAFLRQTGYPHGRPGYVVDHIVPLECGGADSPSNMQWQTVAAARAKDRTERSCLH